MSSRVKDGVLLGASPSLLNSFDMDTAFGCPRRGWFRYVGGREEKGSPSTDLGKALHTLNEAFLEGSELPGKECSLAGGLFEQGREYLERIWWMPGRSRLQVEQAFNVAVDGVPFNGFCDLSFECDGVLHVVDWKTSSDPKKYGKKPRDLPTDPQMLIYAHAFMPGGVKGVKMIHGQYKTKPPFGFTPIEAEVAADSIARGINSVIIPKLDAVRKAVSEKDVSKLPKAPESKCRRCPHAEYCPGTERNETMSIFSRYVKTEAPAVAPSTPQTAPEMVAALEASVAAVEAPAVEAPAVEAPAVEAPAVEAPAVEAPKKRGRPLGAKATKPASGITYKVVTASFGLTINLGAFNSARIDVSMTAEGEDPEAVYEELMARVKAKVEAEAEKLPLPKGDK